MQCWSEFLAIGKLPKYDDLHYSCSLRLPWVKVQDPTPAVRLGWHRSESFYSVFHRFRQDKFVYDGSSLSLSQQNNAHYKNSQNWLKIIFSLPWSKLVKKTAVTFTSTIFHNDNVCLEVKIILKWKVRCLLILNQWFPTEVSYL